MKVIGGTYESDTGLIVRVEDNLVVLFSDITMHEVSSFPIKPNWAPFAEPSSLANV